MPASKVSVPLDVVMRIAVNTAARGIVPPDVRVPAALLFPRVDNSDHVLLVTLTITMLPCQTDAAALLFTILKPVEKRSAVPLWTETVPKYPDTVYVGVVPVPSWIIISDVPLVLTPLNITVIRFTYDGMPVKLMLVPEVDAFAVPALKDPAGPTGP